MEDHLPSFCIQRYTFFRIYANFLPIIFRFYAKISVRVKSTSTRCINQI